MLRSTEAGKTLWGQCVLSRASRIRVGQLRDLPRRFGPSARSRLRSRAAYVRENQRRWSFREGQLVALLMVYDEVGDAMAKKMSESECVGWAGLCPESRGKLWRSLCLWK